MTAATGNDLDKMSFICRMISYLSASYVYTACGPPIKNGVIGVGAEGLIEEVLSPEAAKQKNIGQITFHEGLLVPGFVNTHCHLELSNLRGRIERNTGLTAFVQAVMKLRTTDEYELDAAMLRADIEMLENGIVAVGDISNQLVSRMIKRGSLISYHTFVEVIGFNPDLAGPAVARALELKQAFEPLQASLAPHAPYSVSEPLFASLRAISEMEEDGCISIHNQETKDEDLFFESGTGSFPELYNTLGLDISFYTASGKSSLQTCLPLLPAGKKVLLVHNTFTGRADVKFAKAAHSRLYWCLCPNANLYIENRLPDVNMLMEEGLTITLGTDSLASNDCLSIFAEMQTLQAHFNVPVQELIRWACWNGADFLGITDKFGSFEPGKRPGINLLKFSEKAGKVMLGSSMKRLY